MEAGLADGQHEGPGLEVVNDPDDSRLADYRHLNDAEARAAVGRDGNDAAGCTIVEGAVALDVVVRSRVPLRSVLLTSGRAERLAPLLSMLGPEVSRFVADREVLRRIVGFDLHRGVLASAHRPAPPSPDALLEQARRVALTEAVNDHENLGALFRNAAAFGFDAVLLDDRTADPLYRRSVRVSSGWAAVLPHTRVGRLPDGYDVLRRHGIRIVALTPGPEAIDVAEAAEAGKLDDPVAFVVGAEGPGLTAAAVSVADVAVRVPMAPGVDSLNVATSLAVVAAFAAAHNP